MKRPEAANSERRNPSNNELLKTQLRTNKLVAAGPVFFHDCQHASEASPILRLVGNGGKTPGRGKEVQEKKQILEIKKKLLKQAFFP